MFFRRKSKTTSSQEELVPHGLIWQAMAEEQREPAPATAASSSSNLPSRPREARFDRPPSLRKLGAISPPIPWPSPKIQQIPKRPHSLAETEQIAAIAMGQVVPAQYVKKPRLSPVVVSKAEPLRPQAIETPQLECLPSPRQETSSVVRDRFAGLGQRLRALAGSWARARVEVQENLRSLGRDLLRAIGRGGELLRRELRKPLTWPEYLKPGIGALAKKSRVAREKLLILPQPIFKRIEHGSERAATFMITVWQHRIHLGFDSEAWSMAPLKARVAGWKSKALGLKFDSRLWTSMAMAAASAALALGMISVLRHYSPEGAPARTHPRRSPAVAVKDVTTPSASHANSSAPGLEKPSAARPAAPRVRGETGAKSPTLPSRPLQHRRPKPRSSEDDDYIAHDTYVYYGSGGKSGR